MRLQKLDTDPAPANMYSDCSKVSEILVKKKNDLYNYIQMSEVYARK